MVIAQSIIGMHVNVGYVCAGSLRNEQKPSRGANASVCASDIIKYSSPFYICDADGMHS